MTSAREVNDVLANIVGAVAAFGGWVVGKAPGVAREVLRRAREGLQRARAAAAVGAAAFRVLVLRRLLASPDVAVVKATLFRGDGTDVDITRGFDARACGRHVVSPSERVDVRYLAHGRKYRLVLRKGDEACLTEAPARHRGGPKGVMAAELIGAEASVDITRRVHKYQGPAKDFHAGMGLRVGVTDLFPFDDPEELAANFDTVRIVDHALRTLYLPVNCPDIAKALADAHKAE